VEDVADREAGLAVRNGDLALGDEGVEVEHLASVALGIRASPARQADRTQSRIASK
jgi:hypothetical protein